MKNRSQSQKKAITTQDKKTQDQETEEELDEILKEITLKKGRNAYSIYITEMFHKEREKNKDLTLIEASKKYSAKWKKVSVDEKARYNALSQQEKEKYKKDLDIVKTKLIKYNGKEGATAYRLYLDDYLRKAFENDENPKEAKREAKEAWNDMSSEEKRKWRDTSKKNDNWWENAKKTGTINSYAVFVQKKIAEDNSLTFKTVSELWNKATNKEKRKYLKFADEINKQRQEMRDAYEIEHGIKPKRPAGAIRLFIQQMSKEGKLAGGNGLKIGLKLWKDLKEEDKEKYLNQSHRQQLLYKYKKNMFNQSQKKHFKTKARSAYNIFAAQLNNEDKPKKMKFFEWAFSEWEKLDEKAKEKYNAKAQKEKEKFEQEKKENEDKIFDYPKKPKSTYQLFVSERILELIKENPKEQAKILLSQCAEEWNGMSKANKNKYTKEGERERKRYKSQMKELDEFGYYTISQKEKDIRLSQSQRRKSQRASQSQKKNRSQIK